MKAPRPRLFAAALALLLSAPALAQQAPEAARAQHFMVAAANPLAVDAAIAILRKGGGAVDAAIAAQMVLNLVEPQSSGIGGGAFILHHDAASKTTTSYDGRETAPEAAMPDRFLGADGKPLRFLDAAVGGRSVGVPGLLRVLELAHKKHGRLPWASLFEAAIQHADKGFAVSPRLSWLLGIEKALPKVPPAGAFYYRPDGTPWPAGHVLANKPFAKALTEIAREGADAFYTGDMARDIVATVRQAPTNPGDLTLDDLARYRAVERPPVCGPYRVWVVCGMGPPSSGGLTVLQILGMLQEFDLKSLRPLSAEAVHLMAEAMRLAYADRGLYMADADFVRVPAKGLVDPAYLKSRAALIQPGKAMAKAAPGEPPQKDTRVVPSQWGRDDFLELPSTSHISVVDAEGNAVAMTTTIEDQFGSRLMVHGFLLNNELTDFAFSPIDDGKPVANRVEPRKRPRSSMSPTLVFDRDGKLVMAVGAPGGSAIINYVVKTIVAVLDWGMDMQQAIALANVGSRGGPTELEKGTAAEALKPALEAKGHTVSVIPSAAARKESLSAPAGSWAAPIQGAKAWRVATEAARPVLRLLPGHDARLKRGHPWVFSNEIAMDAAAKALPPGGAVTLHSAEGQALGVAMFNPRTLVAARLLDRDAKAALDASFIARRLKRALSLRERLYDQPFYRLVHAEADGLPGLVIDRFGDVVVVQTNTAGMELLQPALLQALDQVLSPSAVVLRNNSSARALEGLDQAVTVAKGTIDGPVPLVENGATFFADLLAGQKTGWFYDQRDNRAFVAALARRGVGGGPARVCDLYCHTGGFAVQAALAGAGAVVAVDRSEPALALAGRAAKANDVDARCTFVRAEIFAESERLAGQGERFDVVIADPPAFVKSKKDLAAGSRGYRKLARLAARLTVPGGVLFIASCSHNMEAETFAEQVRRGLADAGRAGRILRSAGAAPDHPVHPYLPETAYLKALVLAVD